MITDPETSAANTEAALAQAIRAGAKEPSDG